MCMFFLEYYNDICTMELCVRLFQVVFPVAMLIASVFMVSRIFFLHIGNILTKRMHRFSFVVLALFALLIVLRQPTPRLLYPPGRFYLSFSNA